MRTLLTLLLVSVAGVHAWAEATLDHVNLGTHVTGPKVTVEDLKGRVVLFEYWGVNCPPCRASIPHLDEWQRKYDRDTFVIVANHCQGGTADNMRAVWAACGGGDQVSVVDSGDLSGSNVSGIPRCFLFDQDGKLLFDGSPFQVEGPLAKAVAASPGHLVAGYAWNRLKREALAIGKRQNVGPALKSVRKSAAGTDAAAQTEAVELLRRVAEWTAQQKTAMDEARAGDPAESARIAATMSVLLKGDALAEPFDAMMKDLKADKAAMQAIRGADQLAGIKAKAAQYGLTADPAAFIARVGNRPKAQEIADGLRAVATRYAGTKAADEAGELARTWKLDG